MKHKLTLPLILKIQFASIFYYKNNAEVNIFKNISSPDPSFFGNQEAKDIQSKYHMWA